MFFDKHMQKILAKIDAFLETLKILPKNLLFLPKVEQRNANRPPAGARYKRAAILVVRLGQNRKVNTFKILGDFRLFLCLMCELSPPQETKAVRMPGGQGGGAPL